MVKILIIKFLRDTGKTGYAGRYDISVIVQKTPCFLPILKMDNGDIEALAELEPFGVDSVVVGRAFYEGKIELDEVF